jgi:hypothetical protein
VRKKYAQAVQTGNRMVFGIKGILVELITWQGNKKNGTRAPREIIKMKRNGTGRHTTHSWEEVTLTGTSITSYA